MQVGLWELGVEVLSKSFEVLSKSWFWLQHPCVSWFGIQHPCKALPRIGTDDWVRDRWLAESYCEEL